jgi:HlyD family secretion protein
MKKRLPLLIVIAAVIAVGVYLYPRLKPKAAPANQLVLSGNIETHESLVGFKVTGRVVELPIVEGQWVKAGTLLARLDDADYRQKVDIDAANLKVRESNLALTLAGSREQEIKAADAAVRDAHADLEQKQIDDERAQRLFAKDAISAQDRDLAATALKRSKAAYESAQERSDQTREGSRKEDIRIAQANVAMARQSLGLSRINLDYTRLFSPNAGVISVRQAELGEVVSPGTPIVTLSDLDHVWLRAYIAETDLGKIRWGQDATISTDTYPGKKYHGRISFISSVAEFTPKSVQTYKERVTLVYRIKIDAENPNHELKPGMPADATIEFASNGPASNPPAPQASRAESIPQATASK